jgi:hypothetical protein
MGQTSRTPMFLPERRLHRPPNEAGRGYTLVTSTEIRDSWYSVMNMIKQERTSKKSFLTKGQ